MSKTKSYAKIDTWLKNLANGNLRSKTVQALHFIKENPDTNLSEIRNALKIAHQTVTSAISNFMDEGIVMITGIVEFEDNSYSNLTFVEDPEKRAELKLARRREKFIAWANQGLENYEELLSSQTKRELKKISDQKFDLFNPE